MKKENGKANMIDIHREDKTSLQELEKLKQADADWENIFALSNQEEFSNLLYVLTHKQYKEDEAEKLWFEILEHNKSLEKSLDRDPGLLVSALDYLWNFSNQLKAPYLTEEEHIEYLKEKAIKDDLTGLCTRDVFNYFIDKEIANAKRYKTHLALAIMDIDDFKGINDTHGHNKGDEVLTELAELIQSHMRESDLAIRYGGEEFAIVMRETPGPQALETMQRLKDKIAETKLAGLSITISIGVSEFNPEIHTSKSLFLESSDKAMYNAKRSGKNRVIFN